MNVSLSSLLLAASLSLVASSMWLRDRLPTRDQVVRQLLLEPDQRAAQKAPFEATVGQVTYQVLPMYQYRLQGMVVSRHDTSAWWDVVHRDWNDQLNVADLCVIWGDNLRNDAYRQLRYWSEPFTCNVGGADQDWQQFDPNALSNNHLLTEDPRLAKLLRSLRVGDQVVIEGYLAEYRHQHGRDFRRGTSTVRTDRGDGACETLYVTEAQVLKVANRNWRRLLPIAWAGVVLAVLFWLITPHRRRDDA